MRPSMMRRVDIKQPREFRQIRIRIMKRFSRRENASHTNRSTPKGYGPLQSTNCSRASLKRFCSAIRVGMFSVSYDLISRCHGTFGKFQELTGTTAEGGHGRELRVMSGYKAGRSSAG